jgi:hypothetical protein
MFERKIINAIQKLEDEELSQLKIFINSPYFNVNGEIIRLFDIIFGAIKQNVEQSSVSDEIVWKKLFSGLPFDAKKYNRLYYILGNLFDRFIAQKEFEQMPLYRLKVKGDVIQKVSNKTLQKKVYNETYAYIQKNDTYSAEDKVYIYFMTSTFRSVKESTVILNELNTYFVLEKLKSYVFLLSMKKMYQLEVNIKFMDEVFSLIQVNHFEQHPAIAVYQSIMGTIMNEEEKDNYYVLKGLIREHIHKFNTDFQREIYTMAISYCINRSNQSIVEFVKEQFELFKESVERNIIQENNEISVPVFRNIVFAALRVKQFAWAENFIDNYKIYIHPKYRDNAVYFSLARLEINRENYDKVLDYLQLINYDDVWYQLGARTMQMAAYYKLGEYDALESLLNAYKMFISREKSLTKERKKAYLNLIKFTKKLMYTMPHEKTKLEKLKKEIEETKGIVNKAWLLEKVEEYKTRR